MRNIQTTLLCFGLLISSAYAEFDCPADSAVHLIRVRCYQMVVLTYGQEISTGLCGCIGFADGASIDGNEVTFTLKLLDNEPIRGIELDIYHDSSVLTYSGVSKGEKLDNVTDEEGNPRTMTLLGNYLDDHTKVLAYSTSRARTSGDGTEGDLVHVTYELADGESLPSQVTFYLGLANCQAHQWTLNC